ncbi:dimethylaniline monooxygenase 2 [Colletotrichum higginsianum]|nr:dimethylaniline monooxygenase 2 [Colletotrichum higginsianum]
MASSIKPPSVAVIGAGATGISMLKTLREDGFDARLFERRGRVGGLWSYTDDKTMTTALPIISKYTCGFTDFPMPDSERTCILKKRWMVE